MHYIDTESSCLFTNINWPNKFVLFWTIQMQSPFVLQPSQESNGQHQRHRIQPTCSSVYKCHQLLWECLILSYRLSMSLFGWILVRLCRHQHIFNQRVCVHPLRWKLERRGKTGRLPAYNVQGTLRQMVSTRVMRVHNTSCHTHSGGPVCLPLSTTPSTR